MDGVLVSFGEVLFEIQKIWWGYREVYKYEYIGRILRGDREDMKRDKMRTRQGKAGTCYKEVKRKFVEEVEEKIKGNMQRGI